MHVETVDELRSILAGITELGAMRADLENRVLLLVKSEEESAKGKFSELVEALADARDRLSYSEDIHQEAELRLRDAINLLPTGSRLIAKPPMKAMDQARSMSGGWVSPDEKVRDWTPNVVHVNFGDKGGK